MGWITSGWKLINWAMSRLRFGLRLAFQASILKTTAVFLKLLAKRK